MAWISLTLSGPRRPSLGVSAVFTVSSIGKARIIEDFVGTTKGAGRYMMAISQAEPMIPESLQTLQNYCQQNQQEMFLTLERLVGFESPSDNKTAIDALGACLADEFDDAGCKVKFHRVAGA